MSGLADQLLTDLESGKSAPPPKFNYDSLRRQPAGSPTGVSASPSTDQLLSDLANANPRMSTAEDVARSGVTGVERGATGLAALPQTVMGLGGRVSDWVMDKEGQLLGQPPLTPQQRDAIHQNAAGPIPFGKMLSAAAATSGAINQLGIRAASNAVGQKASPQALAVGRALADFTTPGAVTQQGADQDVQDIGGAYHVPQTTAGRYSERIGEMVPGAGMMPGGLVARGVGALTSGLGSRFAEDVAPDNLKPYAAAAGALVGGGLAQAGRSVVNAPQRLMAAGLRNTSPEQLTAALALQRKAADLGVHITPPEALAQVTNGGSAMTRLQHFVENSPQGSNLTAPIFANRPDQLSAAVGKVADQIAPADMAPSGTALNNQDAAVSVLRNFDRLRSNATRPLYTAADAQTVPAGDIQDLHDAITNAIRSDKTGKIGAVLKGFQDDLAPNGQPLNDIGSLDTIRKLWRDRFDLPPNAPNALLKSQAASVSPFLDQLDTAMEGASPAFQQGKALHAALSRDVVNPANNGPLGAIANSGVIGEQTHALYPSAPPEGAANDTALAARLLPSDVTANLSRHNLTDTWNAANTDLVKGQNQWAGGRFVKQLAGHDEQGKALAEGLRALPNGEAVHASVNDLLDVAGATAKREPPGSMTAFNLENRAQFGMSPPISKFLGGALDPLEWGKSLDKAVGGALYARNVKQVADMLRLPPDQAERVVRDAWTKAQASRGNVYTPALPPPTATQGQ